MYKYAFALLVVTILNLPLSLRACDCGYRPVFIHFKDGLTPNGPVDVEARLGDPSYYKCGAFFVFHDYGPARAPEPPAPTPVVQHRKVIGT